MKTAIKRYNKNIFNQCRSGKLSFYGAVFCYMKAPVFIIKL